VDVEFISAKAPINPQRFYYCTFCPKRLRGHALRAHVERGHPKMLDGSFPQLEFIEAVIERKRRKPRGDIPGQMLLFE